MFLRSPLLLYISIFPINERWQPLFAVKRKFFLNLESLVFVVDKFQIKILGCSVLHLAKPMPLYNKKIYFAHIFLHLSTNYGSFVHPGSICLAYMCLLLVSVCLVLFSVYPQCVFDVCHISMSQVFVVK